MLIVIYYSIAISVLQHVDKLKDCLCHFRDQMCGHFRIQHTQIMLENVVTKFFSKMHPKLRFFETFP